MYMPDLLPVWSGHLYKHYYIKMKHELESMTEMQVVSFRGPEAILLVVWDTDLKRRVQHLSGTPTTPSSESVKGIPRTDRPLQRGSYTQPPFT